MKTLFDLSVSSASGIEAVTKRELSSLGISYDRCENGRIYFRGDEKNIAECNLLLRTASRVYITVASFRAEDFDALYAGVFAADWQDYLPADAKIIVSGKCVSSRLMAVSACQSVTKKAICDKLALKYGAPPDETGARYKTEISVYKNTVTLSLDTSGESLHKRGYRGLVGEAPLKETVAAALVDLSGWKTDTPFVDLFCGSGTFPVEAAMKAAGIPAGINRNFDFTEWKNFDFSVFGEVKEKAVAAINKKADFYICGYDIDEKQIKLAEKHAALAGVADMIHLQRRDMRDFSTKKKGGVFISNPPYGERLSDRNSVKKLYRDFGKICESYPDWACFILTSVSDFERHFGKAADKKRKIYNGKLECFYYSYYPVTDEKKKKITKID
ncbi:MAG: class I SAM-dependent RNA methyltransferase [Clostridia bacterium]|nr:class I SAM-dependent RNA methyltransferase [Clostridia bacterium]